MRFMRRIILAILILGFIACEDNEVIVCPADGTIELDSLVSANVQFTTQLLEALSNDNTHQDENIIISPVSLQIALYMTLNGAEGSTEAEMAQTLGIAQNDCNLHNEGTSSLLNSLSTSDEGTKLELNQGAFYDESKISLNTAFQQNLEDFYETEFSKLDFNSDEAVDEINGWVADKTEDRITKVIEEIDPVEALFLINALYLKGDWENGFPEYSLRPAPFNFLDGSTIDVDMMSLDSERLYKQSENFEAVSMPLKGGDIAVQFYLPRNNGNLSDFLSSISDTELNDILQYNSAEGFNNTRIFFQMPKFALKGKYHLNEILKSMGMVEAFNPGGANLTDIGTGAGNIFINRVLHDTYLKVDEKGVEGAAVTTVGIGITSAPPVVNLNRPYFFTIVHVPTNSLVFTGYIVDPRS